MYGIPLGGGQPKLKLHVPLSPLHVPLRPLHVHVHCKCTIATIKTIFFLVTTNNRAKSMHHYIPLYSKITV